MRYTIEGESLPVVVMELEQGERVITQGGGMSWMSPNMKMRTSAGSIGKMFGRAFSGEKVFQNVYEAEGGPGMIACASGFPGSIRAFDLSKDGSIIMQKHAFLCSEADVQLSVHFQKKIGSALFGGEGFIMQKASGYGMCFAEFDGHVAEYDLDDGESMIVSTGNLAAVSGSCSIDIQMVKGAKNVLFGNEGLFNTVVRGPGHVWLQTMPASKLAAIIKPYVQSSGK